MSQAPINRLAILVSKQVDIIIDRGQASAFIHRCYDEILGAVESKHWSGIRTNSITVAAAFGLSVYPPADDYDTAELARKYLLPCTNVLALWGGGPRFVSTIKQAIELERRVRVYNCDLKTRLVRLIPNSAFAEQA